jgi:hypothetical protein
MPVLFIFPSQKSHNKEPVLEQAVVSETINTTYGNNNGIPLLIYYFITDTQYINGAVPILYEGGNNYNKARTVVAM